VALILNIETATDICSVALARDGKLLSLQEKTEGQSHAKLLTSFISGCLSDAGVDKKELDAIAVSKGPGSFTGLRIGVATAKGLCYALDKPLISVNTLLSISRVCQKNLKPDSDVLFCPMIDARRMEVYTALVDSAFSFIRETSADILNETSFAELLQVRKVIFFGDGMPKFKKVRQPSANAVFADEIRPSATGMIPFSEQSYNQKNFEEVAYFEPFYLKDFYSPHLPKSTG
jgi:tRNA threonylcarbamoyladenosine biosynthesis protein TsaB